MPSPPRSVSRSPLARQNVPLTFMKRGHNIRGKSVKVNQLSLKRLKPPFSLLRPFPVHSGDNPGPSVVRRSAEFVQPGGPSPVRQKSTNSTDRRPSTRLLLVRSSFVLAPHILSFPTLLCSVAILWPVFSSPLLFSPFAPRRLAEP